nr:hypothetical protein [Tanacetum cinerariifolium]
MGLRDCDTWVWVQGNMGCWDKGIGTVLVRGSVREKCREMGRVLAEKSVNRLLELLQEHMTKKPDHHDLDAQDKTTQNSGRDDMLRIRLHEAGSDEEIFTFVAWIRTFNINEPIYAKLCHEFYSTYKFDEVCVLVMRLGLYQVTELEEGFNVYFKGGLRSDEHFNAQDYWLSISREEHLSLSRSHTSTTRNPILRVIHKMITYGLCQRTTGLGNCEMDEKERNKNSGRESNLLWKCRVLTEDVVRSLSALIYCRDLDTMTLNDFIHSDGKLIPEDPQPGVPRVGIPRPPRASMHDLYDKMGRMEIRQEAMEHMEYRQSYH